MWRTDYDAHHDAGVDKGGANLIASGDIKVKQGSEPVGYTENAVQFSDGTELEADSVIFAYASHATERLCMQLTTLYSGPGTSISRKQRGKYLAMKWWVK